MNDDPDIAVVGGGPAGSIAALSFAAQGCTVALVDPAPAGKAPADLRSTALLDPSLRLLEASGILAHLRPHGAPLKIMRLAEVDEAGIIRAEHDFRADEANLEMFGLNFPNTELKAALAAAIETQPRITRHVTRARSMLARDRAAILWLEDGTRLSPSLVVAADGRDSALRQAADIPVHTTRYGQKATVFAVEHAAPHLNISTELHRSGGPFTLVPLPGEDQRRSAVVWMDDGPKVLERGALGDAEFEAAANARSGGVLGALKLVTKRAIWPIITQHASRLTAARMALVAEAAHVVPPIGAQGLNMSLQDISCLSGLIAKAGSRAEIGSIPFLKAYEQARTSDIRLRLRGIDALNRASQASNPDLRKLRAQGTKLLAETGILRRTAMSAGLGGSILPGPTAS